MSNNWSFNELKKALDAIDVRNAEILELQGTIVGLRRKLENTELKVREKAGCEEKIFYLNEKLKNTELELRKAVNSLDGVPMPQSASYRIRDLNAQVERMQKELLEKAKQIDELETYKQHASRQITDLLAMVKRGPMFDLFMRVMGEVANGNIEMTYPEFTTFKNVVFPPTE